MADTLLASPLVRPFPIRTRERSYRPRDLPLLTRLAPTYHETVWVHLGLMLCVGLKKLGLPWKAHASPLEEVALKHGTWLETLGPGGTPFVSPFLATEYHFTMSAGLYLELVAGS